MRRFKGSAAVAAAGSAVLALLLAGCGGGSDDAAAAHGVGAGASAGTAASGGTGASGGTEASASAGAAAGRTSAPAGGGAGASASAGSPGGHAQSPAAGSGPGTQTVQQVASQLTGTWQGETDGSVVTLSVKGVQAAVIADGHVCQGTIQDMGVPMLAMTCTDGDKNRVMGIVQSNDGGTAVIAWGDTKRDTLKKTKSLAPKADTLPTAGAPSGGTSTAGPTAGPTAGRTAP